MRLVLPLLTMLCIAGVEAHTASDSYLYVDSEATGTLRVDVALQDLQLVLNLDSDNSGDVTWRELRGEQLALAALLQRGLQVSSGEGDCETAVQLVGVSTYRDQAFAVSQLRVSCHGGAPARTLKYSLLFDRDALHRAVVTRKVGGRYQIETLSPRRPEFRLSGELPLLQRAWQRIRLYLTGF